MTRGWMRAFGIGAVVTALGLLLVPQRSPGARIPWYRVADTDAERYIRMTSGESQPYPWGGRWGAPGLARLLPLDPADALYVVNVVSLLLALTAISWLALQLTGRVAPVAVTWAVTATGAALLVTFQNPYLTDATALLAFTVIGILFVRQQWAWLAVAIVAAVTIKEVCIGFVLLLVLGRQWRLAVATGAAGLAMLYLGWRIADPGGATPVELGLGSVVKLYFGLGGTWVLLAAVAALLLRARRSWTRYTTGFPAFAAVTLALTVASLPLATDTTRLMLFALPATVPAVAWLVRDLPGRVLAVASVAAVPAMLVVIPTRVSLGSLQPHPLKELEQWYSANLAIIAAASALVATAAAALGLVALRRQGQVARSDGGARGVLPGRPV